MLAGVRTGCPMSATLFLLALNSFVDLLNWLSDGPKLSRTVLCADDVGSALRKLEALKIQHSIFSLAQRVAGMHLKPTKCFLVVTAVALTEEIAAAIKAWLASNIPDWKDFHIVDTGKYLGIWLGKHAAQKTWEAPTRKYKQRVLEVFEGNAPSLPSVLLYNERVLPVFSYIAQVFHPPGKFDIKALEHGFNE